MSWKPEVITDGSGTWRDNVLRFATRKEAEENAEDLMRRWDAVRATRVSESDDPVNFRWVNRQLADPEELPSPTPATDTAIILASGRSIREVCLPLLRLAKARTVSVNNAVHYADFSHYVFTLDTLNLDERFYLPSFAGEKIAAVPSDYGIPGSRFENEWVERRPDITYLPRVPFASKDPQDRIMTGCSGFGAYQFAYKFLGVKRVFLFGCDHDDQGTYFYGEQRDERHYRNWDAALTYWNEFTPPSHVESWNVSPHSRIESLPKIDWRKAFQMLGLPLIPVVTVLKCGGEFNEGHVEWLQRQVRHPIVCLTDSRQPMKDVISIPLAHDWPGWWSKIEIFRDDLCLGNFLYADLDTVFMDGVPASFRGLTETHVLTDLHRPSINSGLMFLHHSVREPVWSAFIADPEKAMREAGAAGDQVFIDQFLASAKRFQDAFPRQIVCYNPQDRRNRFHKPHHGDPRTAQVVCFYGQPRPWNVHEPWIPRMR